MRMSIRVLGALTALALPLLTAVGPGSDADATTTGATALTAVLADHTMSRQPIPCTARPDGVRVCHGDIDTPGGADLRLKSFDGVPLALYLTLPPAPDGGTDGEYPLIVQSHGWGGVPTGPDDTQYSGPTAAEWAADGYVVAQLTARGWGTSCGTATSREVNPAACEKGYLRLDDVRYEIRDVQNLIGLLVDDGIADPEHIGVTGESYGAGASLALATLKDRVMDTDGSLKRWKSPKGASLAITAAAPMFGWSDMASALMPNGRTLDSELTSTTADFTPLGVWKQSIDSGLFLVGNLKGYYAPPDLDREADVRSWFDTMGAGEPYDKTTTDFIAEQVTRYHSPYYLLAGAYGVERQAPAPLFVASGFTDDVFPVDEALRHYNLERKLYPKAPITLHLYDGGHQRAQNKPADGELLGKGIKAFFDHYLKGTGTQPATDVTALTQSCPKTEPSGGPYRAATGAGLHPGEVRHSSRPAQTVRSDAGDPAISKAFDPVAGGLACTTAPAADQGPGVATYRLPPASGSGYTLLGSPTVSATLDVTGEHAYVAARLLDVDPATDTETLVARGVYRIDPAAPDGKVTFQLHPGAWHFAAGHIAKLELLGRDAPYLRPSNGEFSISVSDMTLQLPVHEKAGATGSPAEVRTFAQLSPTHVGTVDARAAKPAGSASRGPNTGVIVLIALVVLAVLAAAVAVVARRRSDQPTHP